MGSYTNVWRWLSQYKLGGSRSAAQVKHFVMTSVLGSSARYSSLQEAARGLTAQAPEVDAESDAPDGDVGSSGDDTGSGSDRDGSSSDSNSEDSDDDDAPESDCASSPARKGRGTRGQA